MSVQDRLRSLSRNVDSLNENITSTKVSLHAPVVQSRLYNSHSLKSGLIPNLVETLSQHATLSQEAADARAQHNALSQLLTCRDELRRLSRLVENAKLPEATKASLALEARIMSAPEVLLKSEVMADLKVLSHTWLLPMLVCAHFCVLDVSANARLCGIARKSNFSTHIPAVLSCLLRRSL